MKFQLLLISHSPCSFQSKLAVFFAEIIFSKNGVDFQWISQKFTSLDKSYIHKSLLDSSLGLDAVLGAKPLQFPESLLLDWENLRHNLSLSD